MVGDEREAGRSAGGQSVEVVAVARRRTFDGGYKRRILEEIDRAGPGETGLILRREGLYSSHLSTWRRWRRDMGGKKRKKKPEGKSANEKRQAKEIAKLKLKLAKAEAMLELQKKAAEIWDMADEQSETDS
jgi:transposase-like protein